MITADGTTLLHWNYFLTVEEDLQRLSRYVDFAEPNFETYSIEMTRLLFAAAAEADIVAKQLCGRLRPGSRADNMDHYREILCANLPVLQRAGVRIPRYGLTLAPWSNWLENRNPDWWHAYNDVKHRRHAEYPSANLRHTLNAVGGLFVLLLFFYREEASSGELAPNPTLLDLGEPFGRNAVLYHASGARLYSLDVLEQPSLNN